MREMRNWREHLIERLAADQEEAIGFLQAVMEDYQVFGNPAAVMSAVQAVVEAQGGVTEVAKRTTMSPETLSKILSSNEAPYLDTFVTILKALGCRLSIEPLKAENCSPDRAGVDPSVAPPSVAPIESIKSEVALATDNK